MAQNGVLLFADSGERHGSVASFKSNNKLFLYGKAGGIFGRRFFI